MLPVYRAHSFQGILKRGGRTKPWVVLVNEGTKLVPYVVKMFDPVLIENRDSVTNEVIGNVLAQEFDIPVPRAALIEMDYDFEMTINDPDAIDIYPLKDERIKFGTQLIEGIYEMNPHAFTIAQIKRLTDVDSVFAFDNLIRNRDRNFGKPNLLIRSDEYFLIDHELGFEIELDTIEELKNKQWDNHFYRYHIFYEYLRSSWRKHKEQFFDLFEEYLKYLNINKLNQYFDQLSNYGYSSERHLIIIDYLLGMKRNSGSFVNLLKGVIS